jgi:hypothetical protein
LRLLEPSGPKIKTPTTTIRPEKQNMLSCTQ